VADELPSPRDRSLPSQIGRYRIVARIGRGAMGVVYSAVDEVMGRQVALKVLMADLESDPETRTRFYREAQAAARLLHPNIITVHDAGDDRGRSFIAMQLLQGAPLPAYLKRPEAAPLERRLDLMIQICEGLAAAHAHGIIHRDLKPNNLFVETDGLLKILDFGVARFADSSMTAAGTMLGTPDYMSPEQARGSQVDARSDIFSAGAVFYFMLAGHKPFPGTDLPAILYQLQRHEVPTVPGIPPELSAIVLQAMAKDPDQRPSRVEQLLASLIRFRRQYHAETRRLIVKVRTRFEELEGLVRSLDEAGSALGLADAAPAQALYRLREAFPSFGSRAMVVDSFEQKAAVGVLDEVDTEHRNLAAVLAERREHAASLHRGEQLLAGGDAYRALQVSESVLAACPRATRARELAEACRPGVRERQERLARIDDLLGLTRAAIETRDWTAAIARSREILAIDQTHADASVLLAQAEQALAVQQRRLASQVQGLVERALEAIGRHAFDEADGVLREAEILQRQAPPVLAARQRLAEARAAAAAAAVLRQRSAEEIRRARAVFRRGRYEDAIGELRAFVELEPAAQEAIAEMDRLIALYREIAAGASARRDAVQERVSVALTAANGSRLEDAIAAAREGLARDPASADASELLDLLLRRQLKERLDLERLHARERRLAECAPLLVAARDALDRGYVAIALDAAMAARRIAPDHPEIDPLVERAQRELHADDEQAFPLESLPWPDAGLTPDVNLQIDPLDRGRDEGRVFGWATDLLRRRKV
jgi:serine/threonine-protein kinase